MAVARELPEHGRLDKRSQVEHRPGDIRWGGLRRGSRQPRGDVLADLLSLCCADLPGLCDVAVHDTRAGTGSQLGAAVSEGNMAGSRKI